MVNILSVDKIAELVRAHTLDQFFLDLIEVLKEDFSRWQEFTKIPRPSFENSEGVLELMPIADKELFGYKYVNAHPNNPLKKKQTVTATGQLARMSDGYPILISEMTLLTALRTGATSALATSLLAREDAQTLALIGTGAQSDFQALAVKLVRDIKTIRFYDTDPAAMKRFEKNMALHGFELIPCQSTEEAVNGADIVTVCTACKAHVVVIEDEWIKPGMHINALGGDSPGKTELDREILTRSTVIVEFFKQSLAEGEIQQFSQEEAKAIVHAELWQLIRNEKCGRSSEDEITVFDSVGFALEDFAVLRMVSELVKQYNINVPMRMVPELDDPKNLYSALLYNPPVMISPAVNTPPPLKVASAC